MKRILIPALLVLCCLTLAACSCEHQWADAGCDKPKTCTLCGETEGDPVAHSWQPADCETPRTCTLCGETEGTPDGHSWQPADCETPKTCTLCGAAQGSALGHNYADATCETAKLCRDCGAADGEPLGHDWQDATTDAPQTCLRCALTEGDRIITDGRFTTEKSKLVFGTWAGDLSLPMEQVEPALAKYDPLLECRMVLTFRIDGTMAVTLQIQENSQLRAALVQYTIDSLYNNMMALGIGKNAVEQKFLEMYGTPIAEYAETQVANTPIQDVIENTRQEYVYYVSSGTLFVCANWSGIMEGYAVAVSGDQLLLGTPKGDSVSFHAVNE